MWQVHVINARERARIGLFLSSLHVLQLSDVAQRLCGAIRYDCYYQNTSITFLYIRF